MWAEYAGVQTALAAIDEREANDRLDAARAQAAVRASGLKSVAAQKAAAEADPDVRAAASDAAVTYAIRKLTGAVHEGCVANAAAASREQTRRATRAPSEARIRRMNP